MLPVCTLRSMSSVDSLPSKTDSICARAARQLRGARRRAAVVEGAAAGGG
jgi:hypothetical protein